MSVGMQMLLRVLVLMTVPVFGSACFFVICPDCAPINYGCFGGPTFVDTYFVLPIRHHPLFFGAVSGVVLLAGIVSEMLWAWRDAMDRRRALADAGPRQLDLFGDDAGELRA